MARVFCAALFAVWRIADPCGAVLSVLSVVPCRAFRGAVPCVPCFPWCRAVMPWRAVVLFSWPAWCRDCRGAVACCRAVQVTGMVP
jgi:hypothetical protein